ncbi:MAG: hypothetical protein IT374_28150 [Polyangiaceae bacterium]|nr:hypothetical protein [Polyangiaceae bacterium]
MEARRRHGGGEARDERQRVHVDGDGAVAAPTSVAGTSTATIVCLRQTAAVRDTRAAEQSLRDVLASLTHARATLTRLVASRDEAARASQSAIARLRHATALAWEGQHAKQRELVGAVPRLRRVAKRVHGHRRCTRP